MMRNRNKIFYPAGLISLILLPILCIWNLNEQNAFEKIGVLEVAYFYHNELDESSNSQSFKELISSRNYIEIEFNGNEKDDNIILEYAKVKIKNLIRSKDTITGVHFKFTEKAKYWNFVKAVDVCQVESLNPLMDKNNIWVAYYPPQRNVKEENYIVMFCGTNEASRILQAKAEKLAEFNEYLSKKINYLIFLSIPFFLMCFFSFRKIL
ncbi:hypothetical protein [Pedobacter frigiditerrae]|uniref:hypothetical protein n=1 Tax=Pedobacter frigiditerrae TaxID=2530452 RepID=UPI002930C1F3|nr:hypothetical protein [Pedobacter frigiditerrae]